MKFYGLLMYVHCATIILLYQSKPEGNGMKDRIVRQFSTGGGNLPYNSPFQLPKWQRIKYDIELKIITGEYRAGERVPSVRNLSNLYSVGTSTSQTILEKMAQEKTLIMEQGIGYKVNGMAVKRLKDEHIKRVIAILQQACEYAEPLQVDPVEIINEIRNN